MGAGRLFVAWLLAAGWFLGWETVTRRLRREAGAKDFVDVAPGVLVLEALWLVLLTGLWFASLGRGGWWLVLPLLGLVANWTPVMGRQVKLPPGKRAIAVGMLVLRLAGAGMLAALVL